MFPFYIWLSHLKNVSYSAKRLLIGLFDRNEDVVISEDVLSEAGISAKDSMEIMRQTEMHEAFLIYDQCQKNDIKFLTFTDPRYPEQLRSITDPPLLLYYKGQIPEFEKLLNIGIVGSRHATDFGKVSAALLGEGLSSVGVTVISGCAEGIDSAAMKGALKRKGAVVGVLGCGIDVIYPSSSRGLYKELENKGCLISEYPPGAKPDKWNFPKRNRIISGLSQGIVVVEAAAKSGSLITARLALEQGRDLFAFPGPAGAAYCAGTNLLIKDGAYLTESFNDVIAQYSAVYEFSKEETVDALNENIENLSNTEKDNAISLPQQKHDGAHSAENLIMNALFEGPKSIDEIINCTGLNAAQVVSSVTMLRITSRVTSEPGGLYKVKL